MTPEQKLEAIRNMIAPYVGRELRTDAEDFMVDDYAGDNFDDAFQMGIDEGEIMLSQSIQAILDK